MTIRSLHTWCSIIAAATVAGCAVYTPVADFAVQRYTNTVAYFNTFYNAQRLFNDAEEEVKKSRRDFLERGGLNKAFTIPGSARQKFQTSIEKNSKMLSFYAESKWVEDALLMIGKAYFYMEDDVRSERKFQELAAKFPESGLLPESRLWLGKSFLRQKKTELGLKQLEDIIVETKEDDAGIAGEAAYELGQYYFGQKDFLLAEKNYALAAELVNDDDLLTQTYFQLGQCYKELQQPEKAFSAYESAASVSPVYWLIFQAKLQQQRLRARDKNYDEALEALHRMLSDSKNSEFLATIHLEIGNILAMEGKEVEAAEKYRFVDTTFARTDEAARAYFLLGKYLELRLGNYDSARVLYNKAKSEFPSSEITPDATLKADMFNKYFDLRKELVKYDSLYKHELMPPQSADTAQEIRTDTVLTADSAATAPTPPVKLMAKNVKKPEKKDSVAAVDSTEIKTRITQELKKKVMLDSLQRTIARVKFELGGLFFLEIQQPDSALRWFDDVIENYSASQFAPRALYTKAEIYRTVIPHPKEERDSIYRALIDRYGTSPYANEARKILDIPIVIAQLDTASYSFEQAELSAESNDLPNAVAFFKRTAVQFPNSPFAAKALYSAGWHYEHSLKNNDSAYAVYKRLIAQFPQSQYSAAARPKVEEYDAEMKRIEDEKRMKEEEKKKAEEELKRNEAKEKEAKQGKMKPPSPAPADSLTEPKNQL